MRCAIRPPILLLLLLFLNIDPTVSLGPKKNRKNKEDVTQKTPEAQQCPQCDPCEDKPPCPQAPECPSCPVSQSDIDSINESLKSQTSKLIESDEKFNACAKSLRNAESDALHLEEKLANVKDSLGSELTSKGTKLAEKDASIKKLNARITELTKELAEVKKEREEEAKTSKAGKGLQKYCNFTLAREDGEAYYEIAKEKARDQFEVAKVWTAQKGEETVLLLQSYSSDLKSISISLFHSTSTFLSETKEAGAVYQSLALDALNECKSIAKPYVDVGTEKAKSAYSSSNLKVIVDEKFIPVYKDQLEGHVENVRFKAVEFYGEVKPRLIEGGEFVREEGRKVRLSVKSMIEEGAKVTRKRYNTDNEGEGIDAVLKVMESDGDFVIDSLIYVVLAYLFYLYAYGTLKFVLRWTVWYPIRIIFWPLFLFGGSKKKRKSVVKEVPN